MYPQLFVADVTLCSFSHLTLYLLKTPILLMTGVMHMAGDVYRKWQQHTQPAVCKFEIS